MGVYMQGLKSSCGAIMNTARVHLEKGRVFFPPFLFP